MAEILPFPEGMKRTDLEQLDREALTARLAALRVQLAQLDDREPEDMLAPEYEDWADRHEELEDLADETLERLEELEDTQ